MKSKIIYNINKIEDFNIYDVLEILWTKSRKVFHGEADFQFELMEVIKEYYENSIVRAEHPFKDNHNKRRYIDILVTDANNKKGIAIELKYKTKNRNSEYFDIDSERYILGNHEAKNDNSYFILKDIEEIQNLVGTTIENYEIEILKGFVIFITNDRSYMTNEIEGQAKEFSLNKINDNDETRNYKGIISYYNTKGTIKYPDLNFDREKGHVGKWINLDKFLDNEGNSHQLFELIFEVER